MRMYWIALGGWSEFYGHRVVSTRIYWKGKWTPFVKLTLRRWTWIKSYLPGPKP